MSKKRKKELDEKYKYDLADKIVMFVFDQFNKIKNMFKEV